MTERRARRTPTRPPGTRTAATLAAATLVAAGAAPVALAQDGTDDRVLLDAGHVDVAAVLDSDDQFAIQVRDDTSSPVVWRDLDDLVFHAKPESHATLPDNPAFAFLGDPGDDVWILPQVQNLELLWPGWSTEHLPRDFLAPDTHVSFELVDMTGPGDFTLYISGFGPTVLLSTAEGHETGAFDIRPQYTHAHGAWAFSAEGHYQLDLRYSATTAAGERVSDEGTLVIAVGDVDPHDIPGTPPGGGDDDDPPGGGDDDDDPPGGGDDDDDPPGGGGGDNDPPSSRLVLDQGHVDINASVDVDLHMEVKDDTQGGEPRYHDLDDVVFHATPGAATQVPDDPSFAFLGSGGDPLWILPQVQDAELLWPGWNTERVTSAQISGPITWSLDDYDGPGHFALFSSGAFGAPDVHFSTGDGLPDALDVPLGTHAHGNWAFTAEGFYFLDFQMAGATPGGQRLSDESTLVVAVGDVDPSQIPDRDPDQTPDPTLPPPGGQEPPPGDPTPTPSPGGPGPGGDPGGDQKGSPGNPSGDGSLPKTGAALAGLLVAGAVTAAVGAGLTLGSRRRHHPED